VGPVESEPETAERVRGIYREFRNSGKYKGEVLRLLPIEKSCRRRGRLERPVRNRRELRENTREQAQRLGGSSRMLKKKRGMGEKKAAGFTDVLDVKPG